MRTGLDRSPLGREPARLAHSTASCQCTVRQRLTLPVCVSVARCQYFSGRSTVQSAYQRVFVRHVCASAAQRFVESPLGYAREWSTVVLLALSFCFSRERLATGRLSPVRRVLVLSLTEFFLLILLVAQQTSPQHKTPRDASASWGTPWRILGPLRYTVSGTWSQPTSSHFCFCSPGASLAAASVWLPVAPSFSRGRSAPSRLGRSRNVVMAGTSRRPSSELGPDLSSPTPPKKSKFSEASQEKDPDLSTEDLESVEKLASSVAASLSEKTVELIPGGIAVTSPFEISEESLDGTKQLIQTSLEGPAKVTPGSSKEGYFGSFETIVQMKYGQQEHSGSSSRKSETDSDVQIQTSLLGEDAFYQELSLIGNGAYGTVYKAKDLNTGQVVALKKVRVPLTEDGLPSSTLREIATLKQLERFEHPHIVRLLDVCQGNYLHLPSADGRSERPDRGLTLWLVFEHVERDLESYMSSCPRPGIPPELIKQMSKEILRGVEFLHSHRIIHRDLKPQNLLVSREGRIKIADFGLAKTYDFEMRLTSVVVTQWYRAPEVLLGCTYATPVDIWSVGCILAELSRLQPLFPGTSEGDQLDRIFQVIGTPSQEKWPENVSLSWTAFPYRQPKPLAEIIPDLNEDGLDLIKTLLMFDPHSRLTAVQALRHRYFAEDNS